MHQLTGDFYTVGEVLGDPLTGIGVSLGLSMNFEAITACYVDVRLERKKEVLDAFYDITKIGRHLWIAIYFQIEADVLALTDLANPLDC